ncbi:PP2C family protein-serine/threonine phosphatase [Massilia endophytica]|uniref:PP2C family protein-serine/threonine phosphatase n=1 Tax=Massilia endophytica TaxID=2899220 RepID=UPI001E54CC20|nr:PP2C family serine/threonine-protein phosphatase [Massilia endophytica]UGQ44899.1 serine/threonine-protein phosphatase [Massilia endophytica]
MSAYKIEAGTAQHLGSRPQQNDRAALFTAPHAPGYVLAVVADGVHGGAVASEQALHTARQLFDEYKVGDAPNPARVAELLRGIAQEAHDILLMNAISSSAEPQATLALLMLTPQQQAIWATVGDTRIYRFSGGACTGRSNDTDYVEHLVRNDGLPPDAARKHRSSRLLANVLGNKLKKPFVSTGTQENLKAGDAFMLCSDGLWQYFTDSELATVVARKTPREAAELLINKAGERAQGKGDNCTMAIVKLAALPKEVPTYTVQKLRKAI